MDSGDLDSFLEKVDHVTDVIKGLADNDQTATDKANELLKNGKSSECLGFNATRINQVTERDEEETKVQQKQGWMDEIAADAEKRARNRAIRKKESDQFKNKGNKSLAEGDLQSAYNFYSQGIEIMKDNLPLWTNRAQVSIKLNRLQEAIDDCDFAFRIEEGCLKAFVHKAKALALMKKYEDARSCLQDALEDDFKPTAARKKTVAEYMDLIDEMENEYRMSELADKAKESGSNEFKSINECVTCMTKPEQPSLYYIGAMQCLLSLVLNEQDKILARKEGALDILAQFIYQKGTSMLSCSNERTGNEKTPKSANSAEDGDMMILISSFDVLSSLSINCFSNLEYITKTHLDSLKVTLDLLSSQNGTKVELTVSTLQFVSALLEDKFCRRSLVNSWGGDSIVNSVLAATNVATMNEEKAGKLSWKKSNEVVHMTVLLLLNKLSEMKEFQTIITTKLLSESAIESLTKFIGNEDKMSNKNRNAILSEGAILITHMVNSAELGTSKGSKEVEKLSSALTGLVESILSLLEKTAAQLIQNKNKSCVSLTTTNKYLCLIYSFLQSEELNTESTKEKALKVCDQFILYVDPPIKSVSECDELTLSSTILAILKSISAKSDKTCLKLWTGNSVIKLISSLIKLYNSSLKTESSFDESGLETSCQVASGLLAVILKTIPTKNRLRYWTDFDTNLNQLLTSLKLTSDVKSSAAEIICANSALALSFLLDSLNSAKVKSLSEMHPNICQEMLAIASNHTNDKVRGNVAIALSKLVSKDQNQLDQLRKLDGLKILHDCVQFVD